MEMAQSYSCVIVDDDEIDRLTTLSHVRKNPIFEVKGLFFSAEEALPQIKACLPDVAFFDIDMPGISGLELRRQLQQIPACIFITSFPDYAVESFELEALDFIVKPINADRFAKTVARIEEYFSTKEKAQLYDHHFGVETIFIKEGSEQIRLSVNDIFYLQAFGDFTHVVTKKRKYCVLANLGALVQEEQFSGIIRIHKSYAVHAHKIDSIKANEVFLGDTRLPIGRAYKNALSLFK
ncbi:MAG: response regulator transcription factor [Chitinophagaceae bacterium]|nr:MAG: response regulator transcription factor [Chitinophagaceae bacterium]